MTSFLVPIMRNGGLAQRLRQNIDIAAMMGPQLDYVVARYLRSDNPNIARLLQRREGGMMTADEQYDFRILAEILQRRRILGID